MESSHRQVPAAGTRGAEEQDVADEAPVSELVSAEHERDDALTAGVVGQNGAAGTNGTGEVREVQIGADVLCSGGQKLGEVVAVKDDYIVVEKGFFMPEDVFVPKSAIAEIGDTSLTLNVTKSTALHSGWQEEPGEHKDDEPAIS